MRYWYEDMTAALIVDDAPDVRSLIAFALSDDGFDIREAEDGASALEALSESAPDCMILDVMMPGLDGFGVLRAMRERQLARGTRVIVLTCCGEDRDHVRGFDLGAHDYLTKPFDPETLLSRVRVLLQKDAEDLEFTRRLEMQRSLLLDRLQTTFARQAARAAPLAQPSVAPEPAAPTGNALPLRWRLGS